jgi:hypothetical protein
MEALHMIRVTPRLPDGLHAKLRWLANVEAPKEEPE